MRILFLSPWCPYPSDNGSKQRIYHLLRGLGARHELDLVAFNPDGNPAEAMAELSRFCREVRLLPETPFAARPIGRFIGLFSPQPRSLIANFSPTMAALVRNQALAKQYDVVVASSMHMVPYALLLDGVPRVFEEFEFGRLLEAYQRAPSAAQRARAGLTWLKTQRYLRAVLPRFAAVTAVSEAERTFAATVALPQTLVMCVPNGVDTAAMQGDWGKPEPDTLIYPGALSYDANFDAVAWFLRDSLPRIQEARPQVRFCVTGKATPAQIAALPQRDGVEYTGYLADVRPAVATAWAEVVPLRVGGGTRLKVLEALALGTPVIATSKGVEGLGLVDGREMLLANDSKTFARRTVALLASPELRQSLALAGRAAVARFDWQQSVDALDEALALTTRQAVVTS
jgi:glycosyltransferase involved in cell wall biosynthesis